MTHISFGANDVLHITDMDTDKTLSINSGTYSGDIEVANAYYYFNGLNELSDNEIAMDIEHGSRYSVTFETDSDFSISSNTDYYAFDMLGADSLDIDFESGATLKGDDIYYNSYISLGENDNLLSLTASCNEQISFAKTENDTLLVQGKNNVLEKGKLFIDEKIEEKEINTENDSFVINIDDKKSDKKCFLGDIDIDGHITAADARLALRAAVGLETFTPEQFSAADADKDNTIAAADARLILRAAVGLEEL